MAIGFAPDPMVADVQAWLSGIAHDLTRSAPSRSRVMLSRRRPRLDANTRRGLRDDVPEGQFFARCLGTVQGWDRTSGQLIVNPLAIFR